MKEDTQDREATKTRIVVAAGRLLAGEGREALTTRKVSAAAGVQAPTIYRLFGDKQGLLDAVAEHGFHAYFQEKSLRDPGPDPVEDLRRGWDLHIGFGLAHPAAYTLIYGDVRSGARSPAAEAGYRILQAHVHRIAEAGRLRMPEVRAAHLVHAAGCGTVLTLLAMPPEDRDPKLSETAREAVLAAIATEAPLTERPNPVSAAITLRATLGDATVLTEGERRLLDEWLERLSTDPD